jgi:hypothetical protein
MVCRYYSGNHFSQNPTRVICANYKNAAGTSVGIPTTETVRFFFAIYNPDIAV